MSHFENFVTGTDENPIGINPGTMGARSLKKVLKAAQVPPSNDMTQLIASANGADLLVMLNYYVEQKGEYAGTPRNRMANCFRLGEREVGVIKQGAGPGGNVPGAGVGAPPPNLPPAPQAPAAPAPQMPAPPVQAPPAPQQPAAPVQQQAPPPAAPASAPVAPAPPAPAQPQTPPAPPVQQPAPPAAPPATPAPATPAADPSEPTLLCTFCQQNIPQSQFTEHLNMHAQQMGQAG